VIETCTSACYERWVDCTMATPASTSDITAGTPPVGHSTQSDLHAVYSHTTTHHYIQIHQSMQKGSKPIYFRFRLFLYHLKDLNECYKMWHPFSKLLMSKTASGDRIVTRPDSVHSDFGALQIIYLLTYLFCYH